MKYYLKKNNIISGSLSREDAALYYEELSMEISAFKIKWTPLKNKKKFVKIYNLLKFEDKDDFKIPCFKCGIKLSENKMIVIGKNNFCPFCYSVIEKNKKKISLNNILHTLKKTLVLFFSIIFISIFSFFLSYNFFDKTDIIFSQNVYYSGSYKNFFMKYFYDIMYYNKKILPYFTKNIYSNAAIFSDKNALGIYKINNLGIKIFDKTFFKSNQEINFKTFIYEFIKNRNSPKTEINIDLISGRFLIKSENYFSGNIYINGTKLTIKKYPVSFFLVMDNKEIQNKGYDNFPDIEKKYSAYPMKIYLLSGILEYKNHILDADFCHFFPENIDGQISENFDRNNPVFERIEIEMKSFYKEAFKFFKPFSITAETVKYSGYSIPYFLNIEEQRNFGQTFKGYDLYKKAAVEYAAERLENEK